jgi:hypothetical protein
MWSAAEKWCGCVRGDITSNVVSDAPTSVAFSSISVGGSFACGLRQSNGSAVCWGEYDCNKQVSVAPTSVAFSSISAGDSFACGLRQSNGSAVMTMIMK